MPCEGQSRGENQVQIKKIRGDSENTGEDL